MHCSKAAAASNACLSPFVDETKWKTSFSSLGFCRPWNDGFRVSVAEGLPSLRRSPKWRFAVFDSASSFSSEKNFSRSWKSQAIRSVKYGKCVRSLCRNNGEGEFGAAAAFPIQIHNQRIGVLRYEKRKSSGVFEEEGGDSDDENYDDEDDDDDGDDFLKSYDLGISRFGNLVDVNPRRNPNFVDENLRRVGINRRGNDQDRRRTSDSRSSAESPRQDNSSYSKRRPSHSSSLSPSSTSTSSSKFSKSTTYTTKSNLYSRSDRYSSQNSPSWRNTRSPSSNAVTYPWDEDEEDGDGNDETFREQEDEKRVRNPYTAELTLSPEEIRRLRSVAITVRQKVKIGKAGITPGVVNLIHNVWRNSEIVKVRCEGIYAGNMKKTHEELEASTGGLVIWRSGGVAALYRGADYKPRDPFEFLNSQQKQIEDTFSLDKSHSNPDSLQAIPSDDSGLDTDSKTPDAHPDDITAGLGPKYLGWGRQPFPPVDADLLLVPGIAYRKPYRLIPYGLNPRLSNKELTSLRREARKLPTHFVLGRNRGLEGLAKAIVQLWDRIEFVKIGVKRGIQNTSNERMAEELKKLTGGILLSRDKYYIVLFRGKDFLPSSIAYTLEKRYYTAQMMADEEERYRLLNSPAVLRRLNTEDDQALVAPSEKAKSETDSQQEEGFILSQSWEEYKLSDEYKKSQQRIYERKKQELLRKIERKIRKSTLKKEKAEEALAKVNELFKPDPLDDDREIITEEERYMFTKLGRKMKSYLEMGVRGVFSGIIENMHLHWKHRELVKVLSKEKDIERVKETALLLESQSGGIFVDIVPMKKYHAMVFYRGKNYSRPIVIRPRNLLSKRQALKRAREDQRRRSLEQHLKALNQNIKNLMKEVSEIESGKSFDMNQDMDSDSEKDENLTFDYDSLIDKDDEEADDEEEEEESGENEQVEAYHDSLQEFSDDDDEYDDDENIDDDEKEKEEERNEIEKQIDAKRLDPNAATVVVTASKPLPSN